MELSSAEKPIEPRSSGARAAWFSSNSCGGPICCGITHRVDIWVIFADTHPLVHLLLILLDAELSFHESGFQKAVVTSETI